MKERPILFSGAMVRLILTGAKTQTRRLAKADILDDDEYRDDDGWPLRFDESSGSDLRAVCPYGYAGDLLWVRETFHHEGGQSLVRYRASGDDLHELKRWRPSIFMPRWASRLTLEVVNVRVERLQEISESDARAEGVRQEQFSPMIKTMLWRGMNGGDLCSHAAGNLGAFRQLWDSINAKRAPWASNPWVWVVEFKRELHT